MVVRSSPSALARWGLGSPECNRRLFLPGASLQPFWLLMGLILSGTFSPYFAEVSLQKEVVACRDSVQSLSVRLFATSWTAARQASLSITNSRSLLKPMSIECVMQSNHLILCPLPLPPSIFPSIRVFLKESVLHIRWPEYWSFSFSISPSNE